MYKDDLTQKRSNLGIISHIVSFSPNGPRGDSVRSKELEIEISNLMLTCRDHGKLIDDKAREAEFPAELLQAYKREHELRVRLATATAEDAKTHVLLLQVSVDSQDFLISPAEAHRAIWPKYPAEEHPIVIDLSAPKLPAEGEPFFTLMAQSITQAIETALSRRAGMPRIHSLSIFAIAPIPLLIHAGRCIGDIQRVDLYQRHRDTQDWKWKEEAAEAFYEIVKPDSTVEADQPVALVFSISGQVSHELVSHAVSGN